MMGAWYQNYREELYSGDLFKIPRSLTVPVVTMQLVNGALFSLQMTSPRLYESLPDFHWGGFLPFWAGAAIVTLPAYIIGVISERNLKGKSSQMTNTKIIFHGISALALTIAGCVVIILSPR